jgi:RNA polymerase sigma factor (sigma-70 family)
MVKNSLRQCLKEVVKLAAVQTARQRDDRDLVQRFVTQKDEAAFAILVERYSSMVLGVCRRMLGNVHDAEDACQASFLVLAQRAASIRKSTSLSSWLHGVAARVASHLRRGQQRRCRRERAVQGAAVTDPAAEVSWREVQTMLDEELERLPEPLRAPLILCYLDCRTRDQAAQQLGLSVACLHGRLERGRKALCQRLTRRGLTLSAALLSAAIAEGVGQVALVPITVLHTTRAAVRLACGRALENGLISPKILSLAQEVAWNMFLTKLKVGVSALLCAGLLAAALGGSLALGAGLLTPSVGATEEAKAPGAKRVPQPAAGKALKPAAPAAEKTPRQSGDARPPESGGKQTAFSGRVLGPDGKPVAGAKVYLLKWKMPAWLRQPEDKGPPKVWARTGKDGRFEFTAANRDLGELYVTAAGYGPGWVIKPGNLQQTWPVEANQVVRLARDDVTVRGRLLDLQGQPVAGATVRVFALKAAPDGKLDKWIKALKKQRLGEYFPEHEYLSSCRVDGMAHFFPPAATDKGGRFAIKGVGRERVVAFTVEGPAIETRVVHAVTRPDLKAGDLRVLETGMITPTGLRNAQLKPYYGPDFTHAAGPGRVLTGVVRDRATGKPIAGATVRGEQPVRYPLYYNQAATDKNGRFRLTGMAQAPRFGGNTSVVALPPAGEPYLAMRKVLAGNKKVKEDNFDFELPRGIWLEGQVKDKATGRGVQANLRYIIFSNKQLADGVQPRSGGPYYYRDPFQSQTDMEGKFRLVVSLERGMLGASANGPNHYRFGVGADKIKGAGRDSDGRIQFAMNPISTPADMFNTVVEVKPKKGARLLRCDILLEEGRPLTVQVRGPDGQPLAGVRALGQGPRDYRWSPQPLGAAFPLHGLDPGKGRTLLLEHSGKNLAARRVIKAEERGSVTVALQPAASVVGRLLGDDGRPQPGAEITVQFRPASNSHMFLGARQVRTDARGRFRIAGLLPGVLYHAHVGQAGPYGRVLFNDVEFKSGQRKDLGDVKPRKADSQ